MLKTKCILEPRSWRDGLRVSVMSRHTQNDGKTPRPELDKRCHLHFPSLAPHPKLVGTHHRGEIDWEEFERRFAEQMASRSMSWRVWLLAIVSFLLPFLSITIMCIEETPERCHRRLLAEECKRRIPWLKIELQ